MRGLEHYLNDIMRPQTDTTDLKGKVFNIYAYRITNACFFLITINFYIRMWFKDEKNVNNNLINKE